MFGVAAAVAGLVFDNAATVAGSLLLVVVLTGCGLLIGSLHEVERCNVCVGSGCCCDVVTLLK